MNRISSILILSSIFLLIDLYSYQGIKVLTQDFSHKGQWVVKWIWIIISISAVLITYKYFNNFPEKANDSLLRFSFLGVFILFIAKLVLCTFLFLDDGIRLFQWVVSLFSTPSNPETGGISRKSFIVQTGALLASGLGAALTYGVTVGSHNYKVFRKKLSIRGLDPKLKGLRIVQISDVHSGSFWDKKAVQKGVNKIIEQQADLVFFTGDMVNNESIEFEPYEEMFSKIQAPLGVYAILGNHDYADYMPHFTQEQRKENVLNLGKAYARMGWNFLRNEHRSIEYEGAKLNVIGVENWSSKARFPKYGDLAKASSNVPVNELNLLLSHDPSHWKSEVITKFPHIDVTFSGHTHGMQFGIETAGFKWSPIQYLYKEWAGLYEESGQKLYVNRGFGYLGYPGRLGIRPEITVFELDIA
jgi:predicted MPP superfamily phosphohydrolase